jgi:hypothetical protein
MNQSVENNQFIMITASDQTMKCYENNRMIKSYLVSTGKKGLGEQMGSECTPRGWHSIHSIIGLNHLMNSVFISRVWTGEIYSEELALQYPDRDWILTRILQLDGLEPGRNKGGQVDSLQRYIYVHGTPNTTPLGVTGSKGCVRMNNTDIIELARWVHVGCRLCIE